MSNYSTYSDEQLIILLKNNDEAAFEELYHRYWEKLLAIGYVHCKRREIAEEIVHDVFMSLWNRRAALDIDHAEAYLATAIKFAVFNFLRTEIRRERLLEGLETQESNDDLSKIELRFLKEYVEKKITKLPQKCSLIFRCSREYEMTNSQIADHLNVSQKAVEAHITRALKYLRASILNSCFFILLFILA